MCGQCSTGYHNFFSAILSPFVGSFQPSSCDMAMSWASSSLWCWHHCGSLGFTDLAHSISVWDAIMEIQHYARLGLVVCKIISFHTCGLVKQWNCLERERESAQKAPHYSIWYHRVASYPQLNKDKTGLVASIYTFPTALRISLHSWNIK